MDFGFNEEQEMLRDSARRFLQSACASPFVRGMIDDATAHSPDLWRQIAELGWLATLVPAEHGGLGGSFLDMTVILEQAGSALLPGPFFATAILGGLAVSEGASPARKEEILPALARGDARLTLAIAEADARYDPTGIQLAARADGAHYVLSGEKLFVMDAHVADWIVVAARTAEGSEHGVTLFLVNAHAAGTQVTALRTVDMTRRQCVVGLNDLRVAKEDLIGPLHGGWTILSRVLDHAVTGIAVELVGTAQRALDMSVAYAGERTQFGRPIGSFQAVKHKCVDMMVQVECARSLAYYAAWAVSEHAAEARSAVPMAKAYCGDMGKSVTSEAIQVHGGVGFTWEHDLHLLHRRALASDAAFGTGPVHRESVAQSILP